MMIAPQIFELPEERLLIVSSRSVHSETLPVFQSLDTAFEGPAYHID
jgi:hypothetical protein